MMKNETYVSGRIGFTGLLTIAFVVLKLTGFIEWSWIWVLSPLWISALLLVLLLVIALLPIFIDSFKHRKGR